MTPSADGLERPSTEAGAPREFDVLLSGLEPEEAEDTDLLYTPARSQAGRGWIIISVGSTALGILLVAGTLLAASLVPPSEANSPPVNAARPSTKPDPVQSPTPQAVPLPKSERAVSDLVDKSWMTELSERTGIPSRALAAYTGASLRVASEYPQCGLGWNTLAGIGHVESAHGTIHGSHIGDDGVARPAIVGIPLTGRSSQAIRDTDAGELDGDTVWDRAVGPMQFIPATWELWGADGNRDGVRDPQNIDDSALAAARYLCDVGGDLTVPANWIAAIHAYNPTVEYNNLVADAASYYAR